MPRSVPEWIGRNDNAMPSKGFRDKLCREQNDCCATCHQPFGPKRRAHCDHIVALIDGGENRGRNLQMICAECHKAKTSAEATARAKTRDIRGSHIMAVEPSRLAGPKFHKPEPQRTASRAIRKFSPIDGVFQIEEQP